MQFTETRCISITKTVRLINKDIFIMDMTIQYRIQLSEGDNLRCCIKFK